MPEMCVGYNHSIHNRSRTSLIPDNWSLLPLSHIPRPSAEAAIIPRIGRHRGLRDKEGAGLSLLEVPSSTVNGGAGLWYAVR